MNHTPVRPPHSATPFRTMSGASAFRRGASVCRWLTAVMALLLLATLSAHADDTLRISSSYKAAGKNADGSSYAGTVAIKSISDTTYTIEWKVDGAVTKGFGMRRNDVLSATYMLNGQPGLIIYRVQKDGTLSGIWAIKGESGNGSEVLAPLN